LLAAALPAALGCAAVDLPDAPVIAAQEHPHWFATLDSGLRLLVLEDHGAPVVTTVAVVGTGGSSDPPGREGLAHLVEHLAFRSRPGGGAALWDELRRLGATFNATTSSDLTVFHATVHRAELPRLMQLAAWQLARTLAGVSPADLATEKSVVRNERRQRSDGLGHATFDHLLRALFPPGHPLARPLGGDDASLEAISWDDVQRLVREQYTADNVTLVIAGDVDPAEVGRQLGMWPAELLFGPEGPEGPARPPRPPLARRPAPPLPAPHLREMQRHRGPVSQPELLLAWSLPPGYRGGGARLRLCAARLDQALEQELDPVRDGDIERVDARSVELANASLVILRAGLRPGSDPEPARARLLDLVMAVWRGQLAAGESATGRWNAATALLLTSVEPLTRALTAAEHLAATGQATYYGDQFRELSAVSPAAVRELGDRFVTRARAVALLVEPESGQLAGGAREKTGEGGARAEHDLGGDPLTSAADIGAERIRQTVPSPGLARLPRFQLPSGLRIYVIGRPSAPIAQVELALRGGDATTHPAGLARLAASLFPARCRVHGSLLPVGGRILGLQGLTESETFVRVFSGNLANGLAVLSDSVTCREPDPEVLLHLRDRLAQESARWQRIRQRPEIAAGEALWSALYPGHPFGRAGFDDPRQLAGLRLEQARAFVGGHFRPDNGVLVVHGQVNPGQVRALAERYLDRWTAPAGPGAAMTPPPAPPGPERRRLHLIDRPGAAQASLSLGCRLLPARPEWIPAYDLLEQLTEAQAFRLRTRWGVTYGVHATVGVMAGGAAHLQLSGTVENAAAGRALQQLLASLRSIGGEDPALFSAVRWEVGRAFASRFASAAVQARAIRTAFLHRWPLSVWDDYPENLAAATPALLRKLLASCVDREVVAVVGDAAVLAPQLRAAGLFPSSAAAP
jgi:zinc protease